MEDKRILYITGCGRSGTTILGFALGNFGNAIDLGEVLDFVRFRGVPNGFGPETENYQFWAAVVRDVEARLGKLDFERLARLQRRLDSHLWALCHVLHIAPLGSRELAEYRGFLRALYDRILRDERYQLFIDSSKYPSRLIHLIDIYGTDRILVLHIMRDPVHLIRAFQNTEQSGKKRSSVAVIGYSFLINWLAKSFSRHELGLNYHRLHFEDFLSLPEVQLQRVGVQFGVDASQVCERVRSSLPLQRGFIFNGNRMRMMDSVRLERGTSPASADGLIRRCIRRIFASIFGAPEIQRAG